MPCQYCDDCPFLRANATSKDPFVKRVIAEYCVGGKAGCVHRQAKEEYDTFLAMNQTPCDTILTA